MGHFLTMDLEMLDVFPAQVTLLDSMEVKALKSHANQYFDGSTSHVPNFLFVEADFLEIEEIFLLDVRDMSHSERLHNVSIVEPTLQGSSLFCQQNQFHGGVKPVYEVIPDSYLANGYVGVFGLAEVFEGVKVEFHDVLNVYLTSFLAHVEVMTHFF